MGGFNQRSFERAFNGTPMTRIGRIQAELFQFLSARIRRIRAISVPLTPTTP
jgi:hypothetical protein